MFKAPKAAKRITWVANRSSPGFGRYPLPTNVSASCSRFRASLMLRAKWKGLCPRFPNRLGPKQSTALLEGGTQNLGEMDDAYLHFNVLQNPVNEQSLYKRWTQRYKRKHFTGGFGNHEFSPLVLILDDLFVANHLRFQPVSNK